jgi:prepilin-type N-terminal cleavage/methylation domain-containing protein
MHGQETVGLDRTDITGATRQGFTLIELLVVIVIVCQLLSSVQ